MPPERYPDNPPAPPSTLGMANRGGRPFRGGVVLMTPHRRELRGGDGVRISGRTTDFTQLAEPLQIDHRSRGRAERSREIAPKVRKRVRWHDQVPVVAVSVLVLLAGTAGCGDFSREEGVIAGTSSSGQSELVLEGVVTDVAGSCTTGASSGGSLITFRVGGGSVLTHPNTQFTMPCPDIRSGMPVAARGPGFLNRVLPASTVEVEARAATDPRFEVTGRIESLARGFDCVTVSGRHVTVAGWTFKVGNAFTQLRDVPGGCHGLVVGLRITSQGSLTNPPAVPLVPPRAREVELSK
jgi:hypothetical protein